MLRLLMYNTFENIVIFDSERGRNGQIFLPNAKYFYIHTLDQAQE